MRAEQITHRVFVHIVTWNSAKYIDRCLESLRRQAGFTLGIDLAIHVTDNASTDATVGKLELLKSDGVSVSRNEENLGFCAAHNQGVHRAVVGKFDYLLILNPDVALDSEALSNMVAGFGRGNDIASVTPKLLRATDDLQPIQPALLDAAGMELQDSLRHFDRGSGIADTGQFDQQRYVFGGTGACLLLSVPCAWSVSLPYFGNKDVIAALYPQLELSSVPRVQLFDEGFFAYREDADLAWRLRSLGWRCLYDPSAVAYHVRVVVPERRAELPAMLNCLSVRNRFLLQINNWRWTVNENTFLRGILMRNLLVVGGVLLHEWSSIPGLLQVFRLLRRAMRHRRVIAERQREVLGRVPAVTLTQLNDSEGY